MIEAELRKRARLDGREEKEKGQDNQVKCKTRLGAQGTQRQKDTAETGRWNVSSAGAKNMNSPRMQMKDGTWHWRWRSGEGREGQFADILPLLFSPRL